MGQSSISRWVLKNSGSGKFKTVLGSPNWWSFGWYIWGWTCLPHNSVILIWQSVDLQKWMNQSKNNLNIKIRHQANVTCQCKLVLGFYILSLKMV